MFPVADATQRHSEEHDMSEDALVQYGSPTLAGLKTGNLFSVPFSDRKKLHEEIQELNHQLVPVGLCLLPMKLMRDRALLYLFRPASLEKDLACEQAEEILNGAGYDLSTLGKCLGRLIARLRQEKDFPHEIGLFLSYPREDVKGFIENKAANCKCAGLWKVYGDEEAAKKTFRKYRHCAEVYRRQWQQGVRLEKLLVRHEQIIGGK